MKPLLPPTEEFKTELEKQNLEIAALNQTISALYASRSWRISGPLRAIKRAISRIILSGVIQPLAMKTGRWLSKHLPYPWLNPLINFTYRWTGKFLFKGSNHYERWNLSAKQSEDSKRWEQEHAVDLPIEKEIILIVSHDASRTGAPILALNIAQELKKHFYVIGLLLGGGKLCNFFMETCDHIIGPCSPAEKTPVTISYLINKVAKRYPIKFAIVNSIESRWALKPLAKNSIPSILLIHEFFAYSRPRSEFISALTLAGSTVFSAEIIRANATTEQTAAFIANSHVLPQGKSQIPVDKIVDKEDCHEINWVKDQLFGQKKVKPFVVLGAGSVHYRKGVDLFIATATEIKRSNPQANILMVWIGHGFDPENDLQYSIYLSEQITRARLQENFKILDEIANFEEVYPLIDLFFISSRLDPLPNVGIDAMLQGVPVICFENTTGIAEILAKDTQTATGIVPFLSVGKAAEKILHFYQNPDHCSTVSHKIRTLAEAYFNMPNYVAQLVELGYSLTAEAADTKRDEMEIKKSGLFKADFFLPPFSPSYNLDEAISNFIQNWRTKSALPLRKPTPGFNTTIYATSNNLTAGTNPFAHYLRSGKPQGLWSDSIIDPSITPFTPPRLLLRCALHIHVFYLELLDDILKRLESNELKCDLFISVTSQDALTQVEAMLKSYKKGTYEIIVVPNRGRDISPLLSAFNRKLISYDVIGHIHTKKSLDMNNPKAAHLWSTFLVENLIGGEYAMADRILAEFAQDEKLGLVYPDDPHIMGWSDNKPFTSQLVKQMNLPELPDGDFSFPVGTMFWARPAAIKPLLMLNYSWDDYPPEPLPYDGSILHAIERLLPFVAESQGFKKALTYVPGITR